LQERRFLPVEKLELRHGKDGEPTKITGYVARFGQLSEDLGGFREKIAKGAFKETIANDDVRMLWNHDSNYVLGRSTAGTLSLSETRTGLKVENELPDTQWAADLAVSIKRGDVTGMSFGFTTQKDEWNEEDRDNVIRTLRKVKLHDVGPVTFPAYPQTSVAVRSMEKWREGLQKEEDDKEQERVAEEQRKQAMVDRKHALRKRELDIKEA
jgi:HK97 family phage prohead protease